MTALVSLSEANSADGPPPELDETMFSAWLAQAAPGDTLEYHRGFLTLDRSGIGLASEHRHLRTLNLLARRAYDLAERGLVHLVQRRIADDAFSYLAIARPHADDNPIPFETLMSKEAA